VLKFIKSKKIFTYAVDDKIAYFRQKGVENGRIIETAHTAWYSTQAIKNGMNIFTDNIAGLCSGKAKNIIVSGA
jgi:lactate dehydrogenase-like 2-hydroxyacid dehydrogenase